MYPSPATGVAVCIVSTAGAGVASVVESAAAEGVNSFTSAAKTRPPGPVPGICSIA